VPRRALAAWGFLLYSYAMHYVYILKLENGQHYIGCTQDLEKRIEKHEHHAVPTTSRIRPEDCVFYAAFQNKEKAYAFEKYLKSSSGFAFRNKRLI
jgi:putative endonuclease